MDLRIYRLLVFACSDKVSAKFMNDDNKTVRD